MLDSLVNDRIEPIAELRREGTYLGPSGEEAVDWLLSTHGNDLPSVIFFGNYLMAAGALGDVTMR